MLLSDLFSYLASGELAQLSMGDIADVAIQVEDYTKVVPAINLAVIELHKRFDLLSDEVIIRQYEQISRYELHSKYAMSNSGSTEPIKYIHDSLFQPFNDNILVITDVYDELGREIPLNADVGYGEWYDYHQHVRFQGYHRDFDYQTVQVAGHNIIQILPAPIQDNNLLIKYRATPKPIKISSIIDPNNTEVQVPLSLLEPLLIYVGGRVFSGMEGKNPNGGAGFLARFEASCQNITNLGLYSKPTHDNLRLEHNGWV